MRRVLFVTSNGTGLGHLTRSMAIARRLDAALEPLFITFSAGAPAVRELGFPVEYIASYDRPGAGTDLSWTFRTRDRLRQAVGEIDPAVVVFDGTHPYERLLPALRSTGARLVWCRRALWRDDADTAPLWRSHLFDAVLEPGELGRGADRGPTAARRSEVTAVDPIVLLDRDALAPREEAERALGLEPGRRTVLVQLGQGPGVREATSRSLRHLAARGDMQVAALAPVLAGLEDVPAGVVGIEAAYPLARYFAAFDAAVSAAGYNQAHELAALGVPALLVPMHRQTDDQAARAEEAERAGAALAVAGADDRALESRLDELLDPPRLRTLGEALDALGAWHGAEQAATWLQHVSDPASLFAATNREGEDAELAAGRKRAGVGVRLRRAWIFAASVPRTLARVAPRRGRTGRHRFRRGARAGARRHRQARLRPAARAGGGVRAPSGRGRAPARAGRRRVRRLSRPPARADPGTTAATAARARARLNAALKAGFAGPSR
jgi:UDP:flavonoid glycosyltransferase YjiC (YdhE family)